MTLSADQRGWGDPRAPGYRTAHIVPCNAAGIRVPVHEAVVDVFRYLNTRLGRVYELDGYADDWGYCLRCIRGTGPGTSRPCVLSNHSWGLAEDLDATRNPMTTNLMADHAFAREVVNPILAPFAGRLLWGGEYAGPRKDYMHFEYVGPRDQASDDNALALRLLTAPAPRPPVPVEDDMLFLVNAQRTHYVTNLLVKRPIHSGAEEKLMKAAGVQPLALSEADVLAIPDQPRS